MPLRVHHSPEAWSGALAARRAVLSIGNFDGLHLGHQQILRAVVERAREQEAIAGVVTFDPHPMKVLRPESAPALIETLQQRLTGFEQAGIEAVLILKFDAALSHLSPEEFVEAILVKALRVSVILVGQNFRFGHRQTGDVELLRKLGAKFDFAVNIVEPVKVDAEVVSSTAVRKAVAAGEMARAAELLGRAFALTGAIQPGAGRGRTLLFPTLNLAPEQELRPMSGVYVTETVLNGKVYGSATNVGTRPTVDGGAVTVESHLFGFNGEAQVDSMEVRFHKRLRDEQKFASVDALRAQIARDLKTAQEYFRHGLSERTG